MKNIFLKVADIQDEKNKSLTMHKLISRTKTSKYNKHNNSANFDLVVLFFMTVRCKNLLAISTNEERRVVGVKTKYHMSRCAKCVRSETLHFT